MWDLLKFAGRCVDRAAERLKKTEQRLFLFRRQAQRAEFGVQMGILVTASVVEFDDLFERRDAAVVHVRRGSDKLTQRWSLEGAAVGISLRDGVAAFIQPLAVTPGDARVMEPLIGEIRNLGVTGKPSLT